MLLLSLKFNDPQAGWQLEEVRFNKDITLLVGLSGVGKTRILDTIGQLQQIAYGKSDSGNWGRSWEIKFRESGDEYLWSGEFESRDRDDIQGSYFGPLPGYSEEKRPKPKFLSEVLKKNDKELARRSNEELILDGKPTPKLPQKESILHILREEDYIADASRGMEAILYVNHSEPPTSLRYLFPLHNWETLKQKLKTLDLIRQEDIPTMLKLAIAYENCPDVFSDIISQFKEAFPYVEKAEFEFVDDGGPFGKAGRIVLKEEGVSKPIPEESISSGMLRTLMHLSRMELWPDGTVVLIDEFENSFGINCINFVTQNLVAHSNRLQFIITSHHPYIINNVDMKNWKIVSRKGSTVSVKGSSLLDGASSHEAFLQLLNLPEYAEGIAVE